MYETGGALNLNWTKKERKGSTPEKQRERNEEREM